MMSKSEEELNEQPKQGLPVRSILKSLVFGLIGALHIAALANFCDLRIKPGAPLIGNHLPIAAFCYITIIAVGWNGIMRRLIPRLVLSPRELVVVMAMTLVSCYVPTSGLYRYFHRQLTLPWQHLSTGGKTDWEKYKVLDYVPKNLWPQPAPQLDDSGRLIPESLDPDVYQAYFTGMARGRDMASLSELPLAAWITPLTYWGPLILLLSATVMSLSLLVHRQWARHEQLSYPIAQVAQAVLTRSKGVGVPDLFRNKLFWWGFTPLFLLYGLNYLHAWYPEYVPGMSMILPNLKSWNEPIYKLVPIIKQTPGSGTLSYQTTFFCIIGLAYFVSSEISLTMGVSHILLVTVGSLYFLSGGTPLDEKDLQASRSGAYIGYALILLYTGRHYYAAVLKAAFLPRRSGGDNVDPTSVFAARLVTISFTGFVAMLVIMGLDWLVALCFALLMILMFLVFTRIICETGIPFMQPGWVPGGLLITLFGPAAVGAAPMVLVMYIGTILCQDPRECLMPYVATGLKLADDHRIRLNRLLGLMALGLLAALVAGFLAKAWADYNFGGTAMDFYASRHVPQDPFNTSVRFLGELAETGQLEATSNLHGLAKISQIRPYAASLPFLSAGLVLVLAFSICRFRFPNFPIHPVLFLVWGTYPAQLCWSSFLIGWAIKSLVVRFGGGKVYQQLKPLFIGLISAELFICGFSILTGLVYYVVTGEPPDAGIFVLPG